MLFWTRTCTSVVPGTFVPTPEWDRDRTSDRLCPRCAVRIWDIHPGYLNRDSLLGEHRELHGVVAILSQGLKGYAAHPETRRWAGLGWALRYRHRLLAAEMAFRGYRVRTPVRLRSEPERWPERFLDPPARQFGLLAGKYRGRELGRIPLPRTSHEIWAQHKYSVLARSQAAYRDLGRRVALLRGRDSFDELALELATLLRDPPDPGNLRNAVQHLWGYFDFRTSKESAERASLRRALGAVQRRCRREHQPYLLAQTDLTELAVWLV